MRQHACAVFCVEWHRQQQQLFEILIKICRNWVWAPTTLSANTMVSRTIRRQCCKSNYLIFYDAHFYIHGKCSMLVHLNVCRCVQHSKSIKFTLMHKFSLSLQHKWVKKIVSQIVNYALILRIEFDSVASVLIGWTLLFYIAYLAFIYVTRLV